MFFFESVTTFDIASFRGHYFQRGGGGGGELLLSYTYRAWYVTLAKDMKYTM